MKLDVSQESSVAGIFVLGWINSIKELVSLVINSAQHLKLNRRIYSIEVREPL
jgi:hypothetical protein